MIILVFGLPGSGKSYFTRHLQKEIDAGLLNTDIIREQLNLKGTYDQSAKKRVYDKMIEKTIEHVEKGSDIIVDGTFHKKRRREDFSHIAEKNGTRIFFVEIKASEQTIKQRLEKERKFSEADYEVYRELKKEFEDQSEDHLVLWSDSEPTDKMIMKTKEYIYGNQTDPRPDR